MRPLFEDRRDAGRRLAKVLAARVKDAAVVLALPRGGVPVGHELARTLGLPLDVLVVRKVGVPFRPELAMGAVASGSVRVLNEEIVRLLGIAPSVVDRVCDEEAKLVAELERRYRRDRAAIPIEDRTVILVDDGIATGATLRAAARSLMARKPRRVIVAVPVGAPEVCDALQLMVDDVVCLLAAPGLRSVGEWYADFGQTTDDEVRRLLARNRPSRFEEPRVRT